MNRWKRENTTTLILMHSHNLWSNYYNALLEAAEELDLPVGRVGYPNCSGDGSWDEEWYTSAPALERVGGMNALQDRAWEIQDRWREQI